MFETINNLLVSIDDLNLLATRAQPLEQLTPTHTSMGWPIHTGAVTPHVETATW